MRALAFIGACVAIAACALFLTLIPYVQPAWGMAVCQVRFLFLALGVWCGVSSLPLLVAAAFRAD